MSRLRNGPMPPPISFKPDVETRERAPSKNAVGRGGRAFIYDIEGEKLTVKEIAARLGISESAAAARLLRQQRTWARLRESKTIENREKQKRSMRASMEMNRAKVEAFRNGKKA